MLFRSTPSARAAAVRLPRATTETKDSSCLSLSMGRIMRRTGVRPNHRTRPSCGRAVAKLRQNAGFKRRQNAKAADPGDLARQPPSAGAGRYPKAAHCVTPLPGLGLQRKEDGYFKTTRSLKRAQKLREKRAAHGLGPVNTCSAGERKIFMLLAPPMVPAGWIFSQPADATGRAVKSSSGGALWVVQLQKKECAPGVAA